MDFGPGTFLLAFAAGALSTVSPCVLPLLPILIASAVAQHRLGPLALAAGLSLSFTVVGLVIATLGVAIGFDGDLLRKIAAATLVLCGAVLLVPPLQARFATMTGSIGASGNSVLGRVRGTGWAGQFAVGCMLGVIWSPCVGPTLGAASAVASQGRDLGQIALLMLIFGLGAGTPLLVIGTLSREAMGRMRGRILAVGERGRRALAVVLIAVGLAILTGGDKRIETWAVDHSPDWLTELTTRF